MARVTWPRVVAPYAEPLFGEQPLEPGEQRHEERGPDGDHSQDLREDQLLLIVGLRAGEDRRVRPRHVERVRLGARVGRRRLREQRADGDGGSAGSVGGLGGGFFKKVTVAAVAVVFCSWLVVGLVWWNLQDDWKHTRRQ